MLSEAVMKGMLQPTNLRVFFVKQPEQDRRCKVHTASENVLIYYNKGLFKLTKFLQFIYRRRMFEPFLIMRSGTTIWDHNQKWRVSLTNKVTCQFIYKGRLQEWVPRKIDLPE